MTSEVVIPLRYGMGARERDGQYTTTLADVQSPIWGILRSGSGPDHRLSIGRRPAMLRCLDWLGSNDHEQRSS
jgi:hypothetical protein